VGRWTARRKMSRLNTILKRNTSRSNKSTHTSPMVSPTSGPTHSTPQTTEETRGTKRTYQRTKNTIMSMEYLKERATLRDSNRNHRTIQIDKIHERQRMTRSHERFFFPILCFNPCIPITRKNFKKSSQTPFQNPKGGRKR
jgi:hypothetical protein